MSRGTLATLIIAASLLLVLPERPAAHEVPANVTVHAFVRPDGDRLRLLVRVPLEAIRDVEIPLRGQGYLDLAAVDPLLREAAAIWLADYVTILEDGRRLQKGSVTEARISLPSDPSFRDYGAAIAHVRGSRLDPRVDLPWEHALMDVLIEYPIASADANFAIEPALAHLGIRTATVLRYAPPDGSERVYTYTGDPGIVRLDPRWHHAAAHFVKLGLAHILGGLDHLLFLLCLVIPFRRLRPLVVVVTSFTVAHTITLAAAAFGFVPDALWFPPLIESLIALSILWMALENVVGTSVERRWRFAFAFGLIHGFGFSFLLRDSLQFAGSHLVASLLAFNIGVELGQIVVLLVAIPALTLLFRRVVAERIGTIILSAFIAHTAWHWMTERGGELAQYELRAPQLNAAFGAAALRVMMLAVIAGAALWGVREVSQRLRAPRDARAAVDPG